MRKGRTLAGGRQAVVVDYDKPRWVVLDPRVEDDFNALAELDGGVPVVTSRTLDDETWIVAFETDVRSTRHYRWDRRTQNGELLFVERPALDRHPLVPMHPVTIEARDGLHLVSYLSLPKHADPDGDGKADQRVPMVLYVHGGPWDRDRWGFNDVHQLFANRGYAVLSVNFRGSTGFGKAFTDAGDKQLGKGMHQDLLDAVAWAIDHGVAQRDKVCIVGGSFGGYAALAGLTLTPDVFACGIDIVGPSNLVTFFETIPPYWRTELTIFHQRIGDPSTPEGRQALLDVSPLTHAARSVKPLLIAQGANDPRVKESESDQIVAAMKAKDIPVSYLVFPDEGHGFNRPENSRAFLAVAEAFLSVHIGGWYQPIDDVEIAASSMVIETGRQWLPGLTPCASEGRQMGKHFPICHKIQQRQRLAKSKPNLLPWKIASSDGGFETHISSAGIAACSMRSGGAAPSRTGAPSAVRGAGRRAASDESLAAAGLPGLVGRRRSCMHAMASASRH